MTIPSINPKTGERGGDVPAGSVADVVSAAGRAAVVSAAWAATPAAVRARLLRAVADTLERREAAIVAVFDFETGLGEARGRAELARTTGHLRMFADTIEDGACFEPIHTPADPQAVPMPRPDLHRLLVPIGPVGVFGPSNFPLAYGVLGGDTVSALAAGCPVIVKGHPSHPRTSALCAEAFHETAAAMDVPSGVLSLVQSAAPEVSRALVSAPEIRAVAFTGSQGVGRALFDVATSRPQPIPFYGELGSLNPLFISAAAARSRPDAIATGLAGSITMGSGQFCTKPGVVFVPTGQAGDALVAALAAALEARGPQVLLNAGLESSLAAKVAASSGVAGVVARCGTGIALPAAGVHAAPRLFEVDVDTFFAHEALRQEHFGPVAIAVRSDEARMAETASRFDGQLTATIHAEETEEDYAWARALIAVLIDRVGRIIWNGYPTGLAVVAAMTHGGPYPATTCSLHSAVGSTAVRRFLRPVTFQNVPQALLPDALR